MTNQCNAKKLIKIIYIFLLQGELNDDQYRRYLST